MGHALSLKARGIAAAFALAALVGCAARASPEQSLADGVTRAVYDNNADGVVANFDVSLKPTVTREDVGALSDRMHALGDYEGLTQVGYHEPTRRYEFEAKFSKGRMIVQMRLDPDGKIAAYRLSPETGK